MEHGQLNWIASTKLSALVGVLFLSLSLPAAAQQPGKVWRIAYVAASDGPLSALDAAFDAGMKQLGYFEGQNVRIERRFPGSRPAALDEAMQELLRLNVDVIVAWAAPVVMAAKRATTTIPIVFIAVRGPVERGIVANLTRPGGNVTGLSTYAVEVIDPKLFELSKELLPRLTRVAILNSAVDPPGAASARVEAATAIRAKLSRIPFSNEEDVANAAAAIERTKAQLLIAPDTPLLYSRRKDIVQFAAKKRLPVVYAFREAVEDGGLMALSTDLKELARRASMYVDKILKGTKPGDLPIEQPTRLQLSINMRTAKTLGLTIPPSLLLRADQASNNRGEAAFASSGGRRIRIRGSHAERGACAFSGVCGRVSDRRGVARHEFNPAKAKAILDQAGWKPGADGIRAKDGVKLSSTNSTTADNKLREQTQALIQPSAATRIA